ncbi:MAG: hypothetical protein N4A45_01105 [Flavobacteriales bacterium]|jgi:YHS domain-containing protein|nr:hypothetical protein [Flavobacteriales bacterium]
MKKLKSIMLLAAFTMMAYAQAQIAPIDKNGLAIGGYDLVSYFSGTAKKGFEAYSTKFNKATYQFSSKENLETFKKNPEKFLPQFDGYCAWGVAAKDSKFPINPETFDIVDGKLYLFFNGPFNGKMLNTLSPWNAKTTELLKKGHSNWKK